MLRPPVNRRTPPGAAALVLVVAWACTSDPARVAPDPPLEIYGDCNVAPNYVSSVRLTRHRAFPVTVFVGETGGWAEAAGELERGVAKGLVSWSSPRGLGTVERTDSTRAVVRIRDEAFPPDTTDPHPPLAGTFTIAVNGLLDEVVVLFYRHSWRSTLEAYERGEVDAAGLEDFIAAVTAHELGHAFGIEGHPPDAGFLMSGTASVDDYVPFPTPADVNTLGHAYCGDAS